MGFYIRKSLSVGPVRFNLSKGGIGVSAGIKGLRLGSGPRGTYIHAGRGGLYYRQYLFARGRASRSPGAPALDPIQPSPVRAADEVTISSAPASQINDSSGSALLEEIRKKRAMVRWTPFVAVALFIAIFTTWLKSSNAGFLLLLISIGILIVLSQYDAQRTAVVVMYDLEDDSESAYKALYDGIMSLRRCGAVWSVMSQQANNNYKYHAGATNLLKRQAAIVRDGPVPFLRTNVAVPCIALHNDALYFLPDRIFITNSAGLGSVSYQEFQARSQVGRFIEDGPVPWDATRVGVTWQYVNKDGSPDRRFSFNRQLPICAYQEVLFASQTGVRAYLQISSQNGGDAFLRALAAMQPAQHGATQAVGNALPASQA